MKPSRDELIQALFENTNAVKRGVQGRLQQLSRDFSFSGAQLELLFTIWHSQPISAKQLAATLHMTPGAVSQLVEGVTQAELIERQTSEEDRRIQYLRVSAKGEELIHSFEKGRRQMMEDIVEDLSDEELEIWLRVQQKMIGYFKAKPKE